MNLLKETLEILELYKLSIEDVTFIGSADGKFSTPWEEFNLLADKDYDNGFGSPKVAEDLVIVFKDNTWIERTDYDGSEKWDYKLPPSKAESTEKITGLFAKYGWETLSEIANPETNGY